MGGVEDAFLWHATRQLPIFGQDAFSQSNMPTITRKQRNKLQHFCVHLVNVVIMPDKFVGLCRQIMGGDKKIHRFLKFLFRPNP